MFIRPSSARSSSWVTFAAQPMSRSPPAAIHTMPNGSSWSRHSLIIVL